MKPEENQPTIHLLDEVLIDQIAAGEVVERPANAVKELVENAIDAGAQRIEIEIEDGGKKLIRITDDGVGMSEVDAARSIQRHATSKLKRFDDLSTLGTLGFRGEALASIASVSRMSLRTRRHRDIRGTELVVEGGDLVHLRPAGGAAGTTIEVRDLFYNVPARQKFMKASQTEAAKIHQIVIRAAMARPEIQFIYRNNGREVRSLPPALGIRHRAMAIFPEDDFIEFTHVDGDLRLEALLSPSRTSSNRHNFFLFINGRSVFDAGILRTIALAFPEPLPSGRQPIGALYLKLPPHEVDVNVHPQKIEVRLTDSRMRLDQIRRAVRRELSRDPNEVERIETPGGHPPNALAVSGYPSDFWEARLGRRNDATGLRLRAEEGRPGGLGGLLGEAEANPQRSPQENEADRWGIAAAIREAGAGAHTEDREERPSFQGESADTHPFGAKRWEEASEAKARSVDGPRTPNALTGVRPPAEVKRGVSKERSSPRSLFGVTSTGHLLIELESALHVVCARTAIASLRERSILRPDEDGSAPPTRTLLFPARFEIADAERIAEEEGSRLERLGFEIHAIGPETLAIRAVPTWLEALSAEEALEALLRPARSNRTSDETTLRELCRLDAERIEAIDEARAASIHAELLDDPELLGELSTVVRLDTGRRRS